MHELTITQNILDIALEHAQEAAATKIGRINLVIGEMTGVVDECVRFYMGVLAEGTAAAQAELVVRRVPITARWRIVCPSSAEHESLYGPPSLHHNGGPEGPPSLSN